MGAPASLVDAVPDDPEDAWAWSEQLEGSVWIGGAAAVALDEMLRVVSGLVAEALVQVPPAELDAFAPIPSDAKPEDRCLFTVELFY